MTGDRSWPTAAVPADLEPADRLAPWLSVRQAGWLAAALTALGPGLVHPGAALAAGAPPATVALACGWVCPAGRPLCWWALVVFRYLLRRPR
jgi:hypothetical protein